LKSFPRHSERFGTSCPKYPENSCSTGERRWRCIWRIEYQWTSISLAAARWISLRLSREYRFCGGPVKVSFFGVPNLPRLSAAVVAEDNGLCIASLLDLAGTKASVVQVRAEAKDYIDIDALITAGKVDLPLALSAAQRLYGSTFNPQITLKALSFFDDGDLRLLPEDMKLRLAAAAREVDLDHLPGIDKFTRQIDQDRGYEL
jgi:hypothetical protein